MKKMLLLLCVFSAFGQEIKSADIKDKSGNQWEIIKTDFKNSCISVSVYNELGIFVVEFNGVSLIMYKNGRYYISNREKNLGIFPKSYALSYRNS